MPLPSVRPAFAVLLLLLCCASRAGAEDPPRNTKPFSRFKILLSSTFLNDSLPFDVPFILWGDAPEGAEPGALAATAVTLRIAEFSEKTIDCSVAGPGDYGPPMRSEARTWTAIDYSDRDIPVPTDVATTTRRQFEFMIRPLKPKKVYCFLFQKEPGRQMTTPEIAVLARRLMPAYRGFLQATGEVLKADEPGVEVLRQALIRDLFGASQLEGFRPTARSVFDKDAVAEDVFDEFRKSAVAVLEEHNRAILQTREANRVAPDDIADFTQWSTNSAIVDLAAPAALAEDLKLFVGRDTRQRTNLLLGVAPDATADVLARVWDVAPGFPVQDLYTADDPCPAPAGTGALAARCARLDDVRARLGRLAKLAPTPGLLTLITATLEDMGRNKVTLLQLQRAVNRRDAEIEAHLRTLQGELPTSILVMTTTMGNLATRRKWYLGMDTGIGIAPSIDEVFPYVGTNIYFRPINFEAPPASFLTRFSMLFGFTWTDNLVKAGERKALYGDSAMIVVGAGVRLTEFIRLGGGALVFKSVDPNPFVDDEPIHLTPYFSFSADIDVAGVLGRVFGAAATPPVLGGGTTQK